MNIDSVKIIIHVDVEATTVPFQSLPKETQEGVAEGLAERIELPNALEIGDDNELEFSIGGLEVQTPNVGYTTLYE